MGVKLGGASIFNELSVGGEREGMGGRNKNIWRHLGEKIEGGTNRKGGELEPYLNRTRLFNQILGEKEEKRGVFSNRRERKKKKKELISEGHI